MPLIEVGTHRVTLGAIQAGKQLMVINTPAEGSIKITVEKNKHHIHISVEDSGVGIPKEEHKKIFSKFFRGLNVIKMAPDGAGLGLFIAKSLIEAMGGEMGFQSTEGKGTTFRFSLPIMSK